MKTLYTIVLFFFSFIVAYSQGDKRFVHDEFQVPKSRMAEIQSNPDYVVESVKEYKVVGVNKRYKFTYNENKQILTETRNRWENGEWVNDWRHTYTYDAAGNRLTYLSEKWGNDEWVNDERNSNTYDAAGNLLTALSERWENAEWVNYWRYTYTYNEADNLLTKLSERLENDELVNLYRYTYSYDNAGNLLTVLFEEWCNIFDEWGIYSIKTYIYDEDGNLLIVFSERWANEEWVNYRRETYTYNDNGNLLKYFAERWENEEWVNSLKWTYTYDKYGNPYTYFSEIWEKHGWAEYHSWFTFEYSNGNSYSYYGYKIEITWKNITSVENKYDDSFSITTFPNPFSESTTIKYNLDNPASVRINIYDNFVNKITTLKDEFQDAGEHQAIFNAENLSQGMYYYTVHVGEQVESGNLLLIK